ncbi:MAG: M1 family metallopeptidase, partial [Chloroflexi bacterium]|nr:M1 family metallopeptidase [Chloroflexota bacterium]
YVPFISHLGLYYPSDDSLFVVSEPDGARYWFPSNDHPRDKATFRFELSVPEGLTGVANGVLVETRVGVPQAFPDGAAGDLYVWEHDHPMATALVTVAVGDYQRLESISPDGTLLRHYVFPERQAEFQNVEARIGEMIDWMSDLFGPYPFDAFGYVMVAGLGASLETQTMVILSEESINDGTMSHEMAHMWFGDWVNLDSWGTMWRNEGFATYVSMMWRMRDDPGALEQRMVDITQSVLENDSGYPLNDPPPAQLFGSDSYAKGAVVVHALRQEVGDEAFFGGLRAYLERYGGGTATDAEFQAVMEEAAGVSLDAFFEQWFE